MPNVRLAAFLLCAAAATLLPAVAGLLSNTDCADLIACPAEFAPVCGSNGVTYGNACELEMAACKARDKKLKVFASGPC